MENSEKEPLKVGDVVVYNGKSPYGILNGLHTGSIFTVSKISPSGWSCKGACHKYYMAQNSCSKIKDPHPWLMKFMEIKSRIVYDPDNPLMLEADWAWLMNLPISDALECKEHIKASFKNLYDVALSDVDFCPWCIVQGDTGSAKTINACKGCTYGALHGKCALDHSTYKKLCKKHSGALLGKIREHTNEFDCLLSKHQMIAKSKTEIVKQLLKDGYEMQRDGSWKKSGKQTFLFEMFKYCGKEPSRHFWEPQWLKEKKGEDDE